MQKKGHDVFFTCREKEFEVDLLKTYGFRFKSLGKKYNSLGGKLWGIVEFDMKEFIASLKFKPDILLSHGSMYTAHASFLLRKPHISLEDTFNFEQIRLYLPFTKAVITSTYPHPDLGPKNIRYSGYHELTYLHPNRFVPDKSVLNDLGVEENEKYIIIRFVSWKASHDLGHEGISLENKILAVKEFSKYARVLISSESALPKELIGYKLNISPHRIHDAIAYSILMFGESATMISEGAVLGVPGVYLDSTGRLYTTELEREYGLVFNFSESDSDQLKAIEKAIDIIKASNKNEWEQKHERLMKEKIDVTAFLVWFVENWPDSFRMMKEDPGYQLRFR